ncbi:hypothetical protein Hanom_Chr10g00961751 [Helianthus anomalus]
MYDSLSYALNFDQGPLQNGDPKSKNEYMILNFSSRYVSVSARMSIAFVNPSSSKKPKSREEKYKAI